MAKLFANKFNLDSLPDPVKPNPTPEQSGHIRIEPIEQRSTTETQAFNALQYNVDNQKANIPTSDEILERQGARRSAATQYVSGVKTEPFGTTPVEQGSANIKLPKDIEEKTSNVVINKVDADSKIVNPNIDIAKVDQGSKITDPNTPIHLVDQGSKITDPQTVINEVKPGDRITNPNTIVSEIEPGDRITNPDTRIKKVVADELIVNPNTTIKKVQEGEYIINPKIPITKAKENELIVNPNLEIKPIVAGDRIIDPNIQPVKVKADELIINPNLAIKKVEVGERITVPNMLLSQMKEVDITKSRPADMYKGIGDTKFFPRTISLKDRLKQPTLGTTRHLPEFILSDVNTGHIVLNNPEIVAKLSAIKVQKVNYDNFILRQGGIEDLLKGLVSYINPFRFGDEKPNQGSITIKKAPEPKNKVSLVDIKKMSTRSRVTNPHTILNIVEPGNRTVDPNTPITKVKPGELITDPKINPEDPKDNLITDPKTQVELAEQDLITNPDLKVKKVSDTSRITIPKLDIKPIKGDKITDPKTKVDKIKQGDRIRDPKTKVNKVKSGERTVDPKTKINPVRPGERTKDPRLVIPRVLPGERTYIPTVLLRLFDQVDDKVSYAPEPEIFINTFSTYPSDAIVPLQGVIVPPTPTPGTVFPGETTPQGSNQPVFVDSTGLSYTNQYNRVYRYGVDDTTSYLKDAGERSNPLLIKVYDVASSTVIENREVAFPPAVYSDYTLPGGYRTLTYGQMQARRSRNDRRNLDFTYEEGNPGLKPWRERLGMPATGPDTLNSSVSKTGNDFVTIKITSGRGDGTLQFRSYLKAFNDTFTPAFGDVNYVGRPDTLKVFKGTTRSVGLSFLVPAFSAAELKVIYGKLQKLATISAFGKKTSAYYMQGPFIKLTVGGWLSGTPAVVTSLKYDTNPSEYSWDIQAEVPHIIDVSMDCTILSDNGGSGMFADGTYIQYGG